jgi:hypothetical protein
VFRKPDGRIYLNVFRDRVNNWIHAQWTGIQTLETIQAGGLAYIDMLKADPCPRLLNDHRELVGRFTESNAWIAEVWMPRIIEAGLRSFAQVLAPGVFGQVSMQDLSTRVADVLDIHMFGNMAEAEAWLRSQP